MMDDTVRDEPDLTIKALRLWIGGRCFPDATNPWDAEQNVCEVVASAKGARVELSGSLSSRDFHFFAEALARIDERLEGTAEFDGTDLGLTVKIEVTSLGHLAFNVWMSPDFGLTQNHEFTFEGDQTDLRPIIMQCRAILARYPTAS
jgi:hypothetical protein